MKSFSNYTGDMKPKHRRIAEKVAEKISKNPRMYGSYSYDDQIRLMTEQIQKEVIAEFGPISSMIFWWIVSYLVQKILQWWIDSWLTTPKA